MEPLPTGSAVGRCRTRGDGRAHRGSAGSAASPRDVWDRADPLAMHGEWTAESREKRDTVRPHEGARRLNYETAVRGSSAGAGWW